MGKKRSRRRRKPETQLEKIVDLGVLSAGAIVTVSSVGAIQKIVAP